MNQDRAHHSVNRAQLVSTVWNNLFHRKNARLVFIAEAILLHQDYALLVNMVKQMVLKVKINVHIVQLVSIAQMVSSKVNALVVTIVMWEVVPF